MPAQRPASAGEPDRKSLPRQQKAAYHNRPPEAAPARRAEGPLQADELPQRVIHRRHLPSSTKRPISRAWSTSK